jgi:tetratricopeptide (TPR) repeat protein
MMSQNEEASMFEYFTVSIAMVFLLSLSLVFFLKYKNMLGKNTLKAVITGGFSIILTCVSFPFITGYLMSVADELSRLLNFPIGSGFAIICSSIIYLGTILLLAIYISNTVLAYKVEEASKNKRSPIIEGMINILAGFANRVMPDRWRVSWMGPAAALEGRSVGSIYADADGEAQIDTSEESIAIPDKTDEKTPAESGNDVCAENNNSEPGDNSQSAELQGAGKSDENIEQIPFDSEKNTDKIGVEAVFNENNANHNDTSLGIENEPDLNAEKDGEVPDESQETITKENSGLQVDNLFSEEENANDEGIDDAADHGISCNSSDEDAVLNEPVMSESINELNNGNTIECNQTGDEISNCSTEETFNIIGEVGKTDEKEESKAAADLMEEVKDRADEIKGEPDRADNAIEEFNEAVDKTEESLEPENAADEDNDKLEKYIYEAFRLKSRKNFEGAIQSYMNALELKPEDSVVFLIVTDICTLYKQLGQADLAKDILQSFMTEYGSVMSQEIKIEIEKNL